MKVMKIKTMPISNDVQSSHLKQTTLSFNQSKNINKNVSEKSNEKSIDKLTENSDDYFKKPVSLKLDSKNTSKPPKCNKARSSSCHSKGSKLQKSQKTSASNQNLLDLWTTVRRSERCTDKFVKEKKEQDVIANIINRKEEGMRIINTADKGRGVESTVSFSKDSFIVEYSGDLVSEKEAISRELEYQKDSSKGSYMFHFKYSDSKYCVDATAESGRLGRLLNHSKLHPNCHVKIIPINNIPRLTIFAKRDIDIGEELIYDYGDRDRATIDANPWLKY